MKSIIFNFIQSDETHSKTIRTIGGTRRKDAMFVYIGIRGLKTGQFLLWCKMIGWD